jgi:hypothetical protein
MRPNARGGRSCGVSANENSCAHGAQINFGDLTPYLTYRIFPLIYIAEEGGIFVILVSREILL